ncbi:MAG TPA: hypothetical protein VGB24_00480 [Longimicrobium sp.]|jgi:hypothetical protein|uniref:hypothetical protein n=1 Tax=Longimicrobium sp. TaxID=2029185 RepID=UPI002ED91B9D
MKKILNSSLRVYVALFAVAGSFAFAAQPATALEPAGSKGCWYEAGNPPACDICGWDCTAGQACCGINAFL